MAEFESEVSLSEFIKRASTRTDAPKGGQGKPYAKLAPNSAASALGKIEPLHLRHSPAIYLTAHYTSPK